MAHFAFQVNENTENIGARRLHTIMEKVLDEISFGAPDLVKAAKANTPPPEQSATPESKLPPLTPRTAATPGPEFTLSIDRAYVQQQVAAIVGNQDLSRYIL